MQLGFPLVGLILMLGGFVFLLKKTLGPPMLGTELRICFRRITIYYGLSSGISLLGFLL